MIPKSINKKGGCVHPPHSPSSNHCEEIAYSSGKCSQLTTNLFGKEQGPSLFTTNKCYTPSGYDSILRLVTARDQSFLIILLFYISSWIYCLDQLSIVLYVLRIHFLDFKHFGDKMQFSKLLKHAPLCILKPHQTYLLQYQECHRLRLGQ